jgi:hypothetical protein
MHPKSPPAARRQALASELLTGRLLLDQHPLQLPEIAVIQEAVHHVLRDLPRAVLVELVPGYEFKIAIRTSRRSLETSMEKATAGLDHDHVGGTAVRMAETITATLHLNNDPAGNSFTNVVTSATLDQDKIAETPTVTAPSALTVAAGGSVLLGIVISAVDSDDVMSVSISGVPGFESVTAAGVTPTVTQHGACIPSQKYLKFQLLRAACSNFCVGYPRMALVPPVLRST